MNGISTLVLFNSGATRSFVSLALSNQFVGATEELDCHIDVEIVDDRTILVARVHWGCRVQLINEQFSVDFVPIFLQGNKVIVGMDWLSPNGEVIA